MTSPIVLRREELYERVWKEPLVRVAKEFGLSDRGLAKVCVRMEIPLPGRGYWRQVETGRSMKRKPLPKLKKGRSEVRIYPHSAPETAPTSSEEDPRVEFEKRKENRILVQPELSEPLPLIERPRSARDGSLGEGEPDQSLRGRRPSQGGDHGFGFVVRRRIGGVGTLGARLRGSARSLAGLISPEDSFGWRKTQ